MHQRLAELAPEISPYRILEADDHPGGSCDVMQHPCAIAAPIFSPSNNLKVRSIERIEPPESLPEGEPRYHVVHSAEVTRVLDLCIQQFWDAPAGWQRWNGDGLYWRAFWRSKAAGVVLDTPARQGERERS
jgi:hypothetical protein